MSPSYRQQAKTSYALSRGEHIYRAQTTLRATALPVLHSCAADVRHLVLSDHSQEPLVLILYFFSFVELEAKAQTPLKNGGQTLRGTGLPRSAPLALTEHRQSCRAPGHEPESLAPQSLNHLCPVTTFLMITLLTCCLAGVQIPVMIPPTYLTPRQDQHSRRSGTVSLISRTKCLVGFAMYVLIFKIPDTHKYTCNPTPSARGFCLYRWFLSRVLQLL